MTFGDKVLLVALPSSNPSQLRTPSSPSVTPMHVLTSPAPEPQGWVSAAGPMTCF